MRLTNYKNRIKLTKASASLLCVLSVNTAWSAELTVNSLNDNVLAGNGQCSLREAIANATTNSDLTGGVCVSGTPLDKIGFSVSGTIALSSPLVFTGAEPLMLDGVGQKIILSGNNTVQII